MLIITRNYSNKMLIITILWSPSYKILPLTPINVSLIMIKNIKLKFNNIRFHQQYLMKLQSKLLQKWFPRKRKSKLLKIFQFPNLFLSLRSHLKELPVQLLSKSSTSLRLFLSPRPSDSRLSNDTRAPSTDSLQLLFIKDLIILATPQSPSSSQKQESP